MSGSGRIFPLTPEQAPAVDPAETVWLSASAGTGKTQVLSARVLRLLLQPDVRPSQILCLTFTKAGATEMASRINAVLARWVRLHETELAKDLLAYRRRSWTRNHRPRAPAVCSSARLPRRGAADRYDPRLRAVAAGRLPA